VLSTSLRAFAVPAVAQVPKAAVTATLAAAVLAIPAAATLGATAAREAVERIWLPETKQLWLARKRASCCASRAYLSATSSPVKPVRDSFNLGGPTLDVGKQVASRAAREGSRFDAARAAAVLAATALSN
jgi:hypothetical protein